MKTITFTNIGRLLYWFSGMRPAVKAVAEQVTTMVDIEKYVAGVEFNSPVRHGFVINLDAHPEFVVDAIKEDLGGHGFTFTKMDNLDAYNCIIGDTYFVIRKKETFWAYPFETMTLSKLTNIAVPYQITAHRLLSLSDYVQLKDHTAFKLVLLTDIISNEENIRLKAEPVHQEKIDAIRAAMAKQSDKRNLLEDLSKFVVSEEINNHLV